MADMSRKHHLLIADAINEAVDTFFDSENVQSRVGKGRNSDDVSSLERNLNFLKKALKQQFATTFSEKLRYTHDSFEPQVFIRSVTGQM